MNKDIKSLSLKETNTIHEAIVTIDKYGCGVALVIDAEGHLIGTITDGDVRRAMLDGIDLNSPVSLLLECKASSPYHKPITALLGTPTEKLLQLMKKHVLRQIPLLDDKARVVALVTFNDLLPESDLPLQAVIMAGGFGTRLNPLTENLPKPMLPVGDRPLMEKIVEQLREVGIRRINVTTHYKPEKIMDHFGDGSAYGIELNYVNEEQPLGTGGALGLIPTPQEPILIINGDILTQVDIRAMLAYHQDHDAELTLGVRRYELQVPYGVIECNGAEVSRLREKPSVGFFVNAGIYLIEPSVYKHIKNGEHFNMTDLIQSLLDAGKAVISFPIREYWLDIGKHSDYIQAQEDFRQGKI